MGWSRGGELMDEIIEAVSRNVSDPSARSKIYKSIIPVFTDMDCDTLQECMFFDERFDDEYIKYEVTHGWMGKKDAMECLEIDEEEFERRFGD